MPRKKRKRKNKKRQHSPQASKSTVNDQGILSGYREIVGAGVIFCGMFWVYNGSWLFGLIIGLFLGVALLPYFDVEKWKPRPFVCAFLGGIFGLMLALVDSYPIGIAVFSGALLGYFATKWAPYAQI